MSDYAGYYMYIRVSRNLLGQRHCIFLLLILSKENAIYSLVVTSHTAVVNKYVKYHSQAPIQVYLLRVGLHVIDEA